MRLALGYGLKRKMSRGLPHVGFHRFAEGGDTQEMCAAHGAYACKMCHGGKMMAEGGETGVHKPFKEKEGQSEAGYTHAQGQSLIDEDYSNDRDDKGRELKKSARKMHHDVLDEMKLMPRPNLYAEGGEVEDDDDDIVGRIMSKQSPKEGEEEDEDGDTELEDKVEDIVDRILGEREGFSEGGQIANDTESDLDFKDNQFDDLVLRDDLEQSYTGENSGDELGNEQLDEDESDLVSRIMRSQMKKDRNPRVA